MRTGLHGVSLDELASRVVQADNEDTAEQRRILNFMFMDGKEVPVMISMYLFRTITSNECRLMIWRHLKGCVLEAETLRSIKDVCARHNCSRCRRIIREVEAMEGNRCDGVSVGGVTPDLAAAV